MKYLILTLMGLLTVSCGSSSLDQDIEVCLSKDAGKCLTLAQYNLKKGSIEKAKSFAQKACEQDEFEACALAGEISIIQGRVSEARQFLKKGCQNKNGASCSTLGYSYDKKDLKRARKYYSRACNLNNAQGCANLGSLLLEANRIASALKAFKKGCRLKKSESCFAASIVLSEKFRLKDEALKYGQKACQFSSSKDSQSCQALSMKR